MTRHSMRDPDRPPIHPGEILREIVLGKGDISKSEFASALGVSPRTLHGVLSGKHPVTVELALRLGHVLGNGPRIWARMQQAYDLWHAERTVDTSKLRPLRRHEAA